MSKASSVIGSACSGIRSRSFHTNWDDVNPIRSQARDKQKDTLGTWAFIHAQEKLERKLKQGRVLYAVSKY